jgi:hypothetical protein
MPGTLCVTFLDHLPFGALAGVRPQAASMMRSSSAWVIVHNDCDICAAHGFCRKLPRRNTRRNRLH